MSLPQELLDLTIGFIPAEDFTTLASCCSASRRLRASARPRAFQTISLTPPSRSIANSETVAYRFRALLERFPDVAELVQCLHILEGASDAEDRRLRGSFRWVVEGSRTLSLILPLLVNLRQLSIQGGNALVRWESLNRRLRSLLSEIAPKLQELHLVGVMFGTTAHLNDALSLIRSIPAANLTRLFLSFEIDGRPTSLSPDMLTSADGGKPQLQNLACSNYDVRGGGMPRLLQTSFDLTRLRCLSFSGLRDPEIRILFDALPAQNVVERLNIWGISDDSQEALKFGTHLPRLEALYLSGYANLATFTCNLDEALSIPTLALDGITIQFPHFVYVHHTTRDHWSRLIDTLRQHRGQVQSMSRLEVHVSGWSDIAARNAARWREEVEGLVRQLGGADLIQFVDVFPALQLHSAPLAMLEG
ncbi:hypothetical protein MKEN_00453500 [Mycena kentingensis (nom. inval.)]|nr:hypothetical protein MKEN_00453500 [Mycena kentingensis (nom. inval.)]